MVREVEEISERVQESLVRLGESTETVADVLRAAGVHGVRNTVRFLNPIIRFVRQSVKDDCRDIDLIERDAIQITLSDGSKGHTRLPLPVDEFLKKFDLGEYPDLEA